VQELFFPERDEQREILHPSDVNVPSVACNAWSPFLLCRETLPLVRRGPAGFIVNIYSAVGVKGHPLQNAYTASKHALRGMTIALAEELRDANIRVHVVCPGGSNDYARSLTQWSRFGRLSPLIRPKRAADGGLVYYVLNGAAARTTIFEGDADDAATEQVPRGPGESARGWGR
jgi:NAD(P)-dependent dehydrogenase (short-subunit alcohol dehydrogenase family)